MENKLETKPDQIGKFIGLVSVGLELWLEAGKQLVELVNSDTLAFKKIIERAPWMSVETLECFVRIGKMELHPKAMLAPPHVIGRLSTMPYAEQVKVLEGKIEIVKAVANGKPHTVKREFHQISQREAKVALGEKVRTVPEQVKILKALPPRAVSVNHNFDGAQSCGFYRLTLRFGKPSLVPIPAAAAAQRHPQRILLCNDIGGELESIIQLVRRPESEL